ncbi:hypothetical protein IQ07DRAFT_635519 [Pyrenochaeta sp. DS3sAY3a]|nr:hypothetical protein IQ07DRAFT_635519 [Pyrenochaeta sp. DS3sAY3a]
MVFAPAETNTLPVTCHREFGSWVDERPTDLAGVRGMSAGGNEIDADRRGLSETGRWLVGTIADQENEPQREWESETYNWKDCISIKVGQVALMTGRHSHGVFLKAAGEVIISKANTSHHIVESGLGVVNLEAQYTPITTSPKPSSTHDGKTIASKHYAWNLKRRRKPEAFVTSALSRNERRGNGQRYIGSRRLVAVAVGMTSLECHSLPSMQEQLQDRLKSATES